MALSNENNGSQSGSETRSQLDTILTPTSSNTSQTPRSEHGNNNVPVDDDELSFLVNNATGPPPEYTVDSTDFLAIGGHAQEEEPTTVDAQTEIVLDDDGSLQDRLHAQPQHPDPDSRIPFYQERARQAIKRFQRHGQPNSDDRL